MMPASSRTGRRAKNRVIAGKNVRAEKEYFVFRPLYEEQDRMKLIRNYRTKECLV